MKSPSTPLSATSLPRSPEEVAGARSRRYLMMMGIRIACFILMAVVQPYGWYTWVFAAGAIVIPYVAVVLANVGEDVSSPDVESPERALTAGPVASVPQESTSAQEPTVFRIEETRAVERGAASDPTDQKS